MRKLMAVLTLVSISLVAPAALAENAVTDSQARLAKLWSTDQTQQQVVTAPTATTHRNFAGMHALDSVTGTWADNYRGGRVHPPAGR